MNKKFKLIVAGGRDFRNFSSAGEILRSVLSKRTPNEVCIVSGGARGADMFGEMFAKSTGCDLKVFPADWSTYGKRAGMIRNEEMIKFADATILFWDGESRGTANMMSLTLDYNKPLFVVYYDKNTQQIIECRDESNPF